MKYFVKNKSINSIRRFNEDAYLAWRKRKADIGN